jgi:hypothetical protein
LELVFFGISSSLAAKKTVFFVGFPLTNKKREPIKAL